ncbi:histidine phosphatase family protein [Pseudarthrobacter sp. NPDC089323]|uniref:histidine phosphatase family protein n=1 Tax=Arthrobacter sp. SD76 TaxID=3415007 RepID=UPI003482FA6F
MTRIILARHGESIWHRENRYAGTTDIPLTATGRAQADALAAWAGQQNLAAVVASGMGRSVESAKPSAAASGLELATDARLKELDFGQAEGLTADEIRVKHPRHYQAFLADPALNPLPGGERPWDAAARGLAALADLRSSHPDGRVLVVAHSTLIRLVLCSLLGLPLRDYRRVFPKLDNCSLTEIRLSPAGVSLLQFNAPLQP